MFADRQRPAVRFLQAPMACSEVAGGSPLVLPRKKLKTGSSTRSNNLSCAIRHTDPPVSKKATGSPRKGKARAARGLPELNTCRQRKAQLRGRRLGPMLCLQGRGSRKAPRSNAMGREWFLSRELGLGRGLREQRPIRNDCPHPPFVAVVPLRRRSKQNVAD